MEKVKSTKKTKTAKKLSYGGLTDEEIERFEKSQAEKPPVVDDLGEQVKNVSINTIEETKNYDLFKRLSGNRFIREPHVLDIVKSFEDYPSLRPSRPVLLNERFEIIDGQHRVEASMRLKWPIFFMVVPGLTIKDARVLNALQKTWLLQDFAYSYAASGEQHYIDYVKLLERYHISARALLLYTIAKPRDNTGSRRYEGATAPFKLGIYEPNPTENTIALLDQLMALSPYVTNIREQAVTEALLRIFTIPGYSHERMLAKIKDSPKLPHYGNKSDYLRDLEDIYNRYIPSGSGVRFY